MSVELMPCSVTLFSYTASELKLAPEESPEQRALLIEQRRYAAQAPDRATGLSA